MGFLSSIAAFFRPGIADGKAVPQPELTAGPRLVRVIVHMTWATPEQIAAQSPGKLASTMGPIFLTDGEWHAYITAPKPADFNDMNRLETLGHEFFHALGATHKE